MLKKQVFTVFVLALLLVLSSLSLAQEYYADLELYVNPDGTVDVQGLTNDPDLYPGVHQEFTSKKGIYWLFNVSSEKEYSDYIISVRLPEGSEFNYLKANGRSRVSYDNGIRIISSGSGELSLVVQYHVEDQKRSLAVWLIIIVAVLILGFFSWFKFSKRMKNKTLSIKAKKSKSVKEEDLKDKLDIIRPTLTENQQKIIDLLLEENGSLTQKQLQHRSGLAKATLSRNVDTLVKKNVVEKQSRGMTNMIMLKKE
jgi:hypothetical protein